MRRALAIGIALAACVQARGRDDAGVATPTWREDVAPVVRERCVACHRGDEPAGAYDLTTYLGALGGGSDAVSNAIAGDGDSAILTVIEAGGDHAAFADVLPLLRAWVVDGRVGYFDSRIHLPGILDRTSGEFHGHELETRDWDFPLCQSCHGADFAGGVSEVSCNGCHQAGPTGCATCHGNAPTSGPHPAHTSAGVACAECHRVPARWDDPGHIVGDAAPAEVVFGALAARDLDPPRRTGPPTFDPVAATCANVFCHGGAFADSSARTPTPVWTVAGAQATCGGCHGIPPSDHRPMAPDQCASCHSRAAGDHVDGVVQIGDGSGGCDACHGGVTTSGAHASHLQAPSGLRGPLACSDCHVVPAALDSPGHVDTDLPAEVVMTSGTWDHAAATCTNGYCHGAATPVWTNVGVGEAACGTCHGIPPIDGTHDPLLTVFDCVDCHPAYDAGQRMDGHVDL